MGQVQQQKGGYCGDADPQISEVIMLQSRLCLNPRTIRVRIDEFHNLAQIRALPIMLNFHAKTVNKLSHFFVATQRVLYNPFIVEKRDVIS